MDDFLSDMLTDLSFRWLAIYRLHRMHLERDRFLCGPVLLFSTTTCQFSRQDKDASSQGDRLRGRSSEYQWHDFVPC